MKTRNWNAVAAHFRRGGPMKHRNEPRGGASNESRDLLSEYKEEIENQKDSCCNCPPCRKRKEIPNQQICRYICILCGNLLKEEPQIPELPPQTLRTVGVCCKDALPKHIRNRAMPIQGEKNSLAGKHDQRSQPRVESDPGALLGKEKV